MSPAARRVREQLRNGTYLIDIDTLADLLVDGHDTMGQEVEVVRERCRSQRRGGRE